MLQTCTSFSIHASALTQTDSSASQGTAHATRELVETKVFLRNRYVQECSCSRASSRHVVYPYSSMLLLVSYQYNAAITTQTAERWTTKRCIYKNLHIMATMRSN